LKLSKLDWFTVLSSRWFQSNTVFMKKKFLNGSVFALWHTRTLRVIDDTIFYYVFIKSEYCLVLQYKTPIGAMFTLHVLILFFLFIIFFYLLFTVF
jgi:hypothetical protein